MPKPKHAVNMSLYMPELGYYQPDAASGWCWLGSFKFKPV